MTEVLCSFVHRVLVLLNEEVTWTVGSKQAEPSCPCAASGEGEDKVVSLLTAAVSSS